mmetsp:Transcript_8808/g.25140  ORF Transcript_8808/g.25140 Transcript_8808/m.25140 type:complete len:240 (+) Transcript_8808:1116-1835(+)
MLYVSEVAFDGRPRVIDGLRNLLDLGAYPLGVLAAQGLAKAVHELVRVPPQVRPFEGPLVRNERFLRVGRAFLPAFRSRDLGRGHRGQQPRSDRRPRHLLVAHRRCLLPGLERLPRPLVRCPQLRCLVRSEEIDLRHRFEELLGGRLGLLELDVLGPHLRRPGLLLLRLHANFRRLQSGFTLVPRVLVPLILPQLLHGLPSLPIQPHPLPLLEHGSHFAVESIRLPLLELPFPLPQKSP